MVYSAKRHIVPGGTAMEQRQEIQFIATNFPNLQGLRAIPVSLVLFAATPSVLSHPGARYSGREHLALAGGDRLVARNWAARAAIGCPTR